VAARVSLAGGRALRQPPPSHVGPDGISYAVYLDNQSVDRKAFTQTGDGCCRADFDACYPLFHAYRPSGALRLPFSAAVRDATCTLTRWSHANCLRKAIFCN
jgi:hypothetical protein